MELTGYLCILCKARGAPEVYQRLPDFKLYIMSQEHHHIINPDLMWDKHLPPA